jgi:DNA-binding NarL/FixJ family response regulator
MGLPRLLAKSFHTPGSIASQESELESVVDAASNASFDAAMALVIGADVIDGARADEWRRHAFRVFEWAGAESDMARIRRMLARKGARLQCARRRTADVPPKLKNRGITSREAEVLALVTKGLTNSEIAEQLAGC